MVVALGAKLDVVRRALAVREVVGGLGVTRLAEPGASLGTSVHQAVWAHALGRREVHVGRRAIRPRDARADQERVGATVLVVASRARGRAGRMGRLTVAVAARRKPSVTRTGLLRQQGVTRGACEERLV